LALASNPSSPLSAHLVAMASDPDEMMPVSFYPLRASRGDSVSGAATSADSKRAGSLPRTGEAAAAPGSQQPRRKSLTSNLALPDGVASQGSLFHDLGACRTCAWFWKRSGCANGADCRHCHACPKSELKLRKKATKAAATAQSSAKANQQQALSISTRVCAKSPDSAAAISPTLSEDSTTCSASDSLAPAWISMKSRGSDSLQSRARPISDSSGVARPELRVGIKNTFLDDFVDSEHEETEGSTVGVRAQRSRSLPPARPPPSEKTEGENMACYTAMPIRMEGLASVGSALHHFGACRPCTWFWKPEGCRNGQACRHCHLCTFGEIKARRKTKRVVKMPL